MVEASVKETYILNKIFCPKTDEMIITIKNIGHKPADIVHIFWETDFRFRKEIFEYQFSINSKSKLPEQIKDGDMITYKTFASELITHIYTYFQKMIDFKHPEKMAKSIKICVKTPTGKIIKRRIHKSLQHFLVQAAKKYKEDKSDSRGVIAYFNKEN